LIWNLKKAYQKIVVPDVSDSTSGTPTKTPFEKYCYPTQNEPKCAFQSISPPLGDRGNNASGTSK